MTETTPSNDVLDPEPVDTSSEEKKEEKKNLNMLDRYIIFSFSCVIIYTIASFILVIKTGMMLDVLTTAVYSLFGGELLACAMIKRFKLKNDGGGTG